MRIHTRAIPERSENLNARPIDLPSPMTRKTVFKNELSTEMTPCCDPRSYADDDKVV